MNNIDTKLKEIKNRGRIGIMTHAVVGYPSLKETGELVRLMEKCGVDMIELQIPFSDPLADGPTIMRACETSLNQGTKVHDAFILAGRLTQDVSIPLLFMCYYNTMFKYGVEKFCKDAAYMGITGLIVPDIPLDEEPHEDFMYFCRKYNLHAIRVLSPASTDERIKKNAEMASGFVYFTSRQGTTGATATLDKDLAKNIDKLKKYIKTPIAVGFGISKKEHVTAVKGKADMAVVGSAILNIIDSSRSKDREKNITQFLSILTS